MAAHWPGSAGVLPTRDAAPPTDPSHKNTEAWIYATPGLAECDEKEILDALAAKGAEDLGHAIVDVTLGAIDALFPPSTLREARKQLTRHFWCDLFAAMARGVEQFKQSLEAVPEWVTDAILESNEESKHFKRPLITRLVIKTAVDKAWGPVQEAIESSLHIDEVLRSLRVLAVLACPAPENHRNVRRYCLDPLASEMLTAITQERLKSVFPDEFTSGFTAATQ